MIVAGIDIGGTKIAGGVVDGDTGQVLARARIATDAHEGGAAVLARALALARSLLVSSESTGTGGRQTLQAIGIGAGGQIDPQTGVVVDATEILPGWKGTRLSEGFAHAFDVPAFADNDVNALAAGESRFGAGRAYRHLAYLALGTGVGGALVHNGRLVHGPQGAGGELGHLIVDPSAPAYAFGTRGCLEQLTSGPALLRRYRDVGGDPALDGPAVARRAHTGDERALRIVAEVGRDLGIGLASLANVWGPEAFLLGGGVIEGFGPLLVDPARAELQARALPAVRQTPVLIAALGTDAAVIGAACLALEGLA
jgi:glucokinase